MNKKYEIGVNEVKLTGVIEEIAYAYTSFDEKFYSGKVMIKRDNSEARDIIPVTISGKLIDCDSLEVGTVVTITGQFRSFNKIDEETQKRHLLLSVFCKNIEIVDPDNSFYENEIELKGYLCKNATFRKTPKGREIADMLLAVNRAYGKSDYIPTISWGRNARYASNMEVGTLVRVIGRIQSRTYIKKISETETEERVVYEVSASKLIREEAAVPTEEPIHEEESAEAYDID